MGAGRTCATACGGLTTTAASTNLYDISVEAKVALGDLLALNSGQNGGAPVPTGTTLVQACYANGHKPRYLGAPPPPFAHACVPMLSLAVSLPFLIHPFHAAALLSDGGRPLRPTG